jgi:hypothetical protein
MRPDQQHAIAVFLIVVAVILLMGATAPGIGSGFFLMPGNANGRLGRSGSSGVRTH